MPSAASDVTADILRRYCQLGQLDAIQEKYSLLTRRIEKQLMPACKELGVSVQAHSPLEQGLLTGKVTMDTTYPEGSTRNANPNFQPARRAQALALLESWQDLTKEYDCTLSQPVIADRPAEPRAAHPVRGTHPPAGPGQRQGPAISRLLRPGCSADALGPERHFLQPKFSK